MWPRLTVKVRGGATEEVGGTIGGRVESSFIRTSVAGPSINRTIDLCLVKWWMRVTRSPRGQFTAAHIGRSSWAGVTKRGAIDRDSSVNGRDTLHIKTPIFYGEWSLACIARAAAYSILCRIHRNYTSKAWSSKNHCIYAGLEFRDLRIVFTARCTWRHFQTWRPPPCLKKFKWRYLRNPSSDPLHVLL